MSEKEEEICRGLARNVFFFIPAQISMLIKLIYHQMNTEKKYLNFKFLSES